MRWSDSDLNNIISILNKYTDINEAMREIRLHLGMPPTYKEKSLRRQFNRKGLGSPKKYLKNKRMQYSQNNTEKTLHIPINNQQRISCKPQKNTQKEEFSRMDDFLTYIANKKYSFMDICNKLNCSPSTIEKYIEEASNLGYSIRSIDNNISLNKKDSVSTNIPKSLAISTGTNRIIRLGVISDTHFGSEAARCEEIQDFVHKIYIKYGVRTIVHAGDILTGNSVYKGQIAELSQWGCENQCAEANKWLPKLEGLEYYAILGNHDLDFIKSSGINPGFVLTKMRDDFHILGNIKAQFILGDTGLVVEVIHIKSSAYAKSYPLEKHLAKTLSKMDSPDLVLAGHRHISGYFELNHVHCFQVPSFEDANFFVHYNDFIPSVGGLVVELHLNEENQIIQCIPIFINYHTKKQINKVIKVDHVPTEI